MKENKLIITILVAALIIGASLYFSSTPTVNLGASSGPDHYNLENFKAGETIGNTGPATITEFVCGTATYDPPALASGNAATTTVTVTGAAMGDIVLVGFSNSSTQRFTGVPGNFIVFSGSVVAENEVWVGVFNAVSTSSAGTATNLGSGTLTACTLDS